MAIKNIICYGIGFTPASIKFIPTRGFDSGSGFTSVSRIFTVAARQTFSVPVESRTTTVAKED